ncbi:MAG TPA: hypothetical protein VIG72_07760 [Pontibacter sp.]
MTLYNNQGIQQQPLLVFQTEDARIELDTARKYILVEWLRHPDSEGFRKNFAKALELAIAQGCLYWLSDSRAMHYLELGDQNWIIREITPILQHIPLVKFARLTTLQSLSMMDVPRVYDKLEQLPEWRQKAALEVFTNKADAVSWLFSEAA